MSEIVVPKLIVPKLWIPAPGVTELFPKLSRSARRELDRLLKMPLHERILAMAGSFSNYISVKTMDEVHGATAYTADATYYAGLWTSALDDTSVGNTAGETTYGSYARMSLTNNTTNFAAGSGTTTYTKTWPSDAAHTWATSTSGSATITYLGLFNGNAGTSADKLIEWCSVTSVTINSGDQPRLNQNAVSVVMD